MEFLILHLMKIFIFGEKYDKDPGSDGLWTFYMLTNGELLLKLKHPTLKNKLKLSFLIRVLIRLTNATKFKIPKSLWLVFKQ
jgi:hypothetical protein